MKSDIIAFIDETDEHWSYLNYLLLKEFIKKAPLPPPLNIIYYLFKLILHLSQRISGNSCRVSPCSNYDKEAEKGTDILE